MEFKQFVEWAFYALVSGCFTYGVYILNELRKSVADLNNHVATIIEKMSWHERMLDNHDGRISKLEKK